MSIVWITRSEPSATYLAEALESNGYAVVKAPVFRISPTRDDPPKGKFDWRIYLSLHAVRHSGEIPSAKERVLAIGPGTLNSLRERNIQAECPTKHSSEGIYQFISSRAHPGQRLLIVCGIGGRKLLCEQLTKDGYDVKEWCVYEREHQHVRLVLEGLDAVEISSLESLQYVDRYINRKCPALRSKITCLAPSERIFRAARSSGFEQVLLTEGTSQDHVIAAMDTLRFLMSEVSASDSETRDKNTGDVATSKRRSVGLVFVAFLVLVALSASGYVLWRMEFASLVKTDIERLSSRISQIETQYGRHLAAITETESEIRTQIHELEDLIQGQQTIINRYAKRLTLLGSAKADIDNEQWRVTEVEYLLRNCKSKTVTGSKCVDYDFIVGHGRQDSCSDG